MDLFGIVAEFNPFHNGHDKLIASLKEAYPTAVVAIMMSGAFTQRGEVAIFDKWTRANMALHSGADLVFELPQAYATASMAYFAKGAVNSLLATGALKGLAFGSESGDVSALRQYSSIIRDEPKAYKEALKETLKSGRSYSEAQYEALGQFFYKAPSKSSPNDRLAMQYLTHLPKDVTLFAIKREVAHQSERPSKEEASGTYLREALLSGKAIDSYVPNEANHLVQALKGVWRYPKMDDYFPAIAVSLLNLSPNALAIRLGIQDGFEHRLIECVGKVNNYEDFLNEAQTRQYTKARIARLLLNLISEPSVEQDSDVEYLRLLGMSDLGKLALRHISRTKSVPLINAVKKSYPELTDQGRKMLDLDIKRQNLQMLFQNKVHFPLNIDYLTSPLVL